MGIKKVISFIVHHPISGHSKVKSVFRFFWWQFRGMLTSKNYIHQYTAHSKLIIAKGMTGATGNLYCGLHEYKEMLFVLHFLRKDDLFLDIGANIGSFTVLASAEVGAFTYCFEPLPETFLQLERNITLNNISSKVAKFNIGLASQKGELVFTNEKDSSMNHVAMNANENSSSVKIEVDLLDNILNEKTPYLMKIDVEGFELEVLKGAINTLKSETLKAIIIELNGSGLNYGYKDEDIDILLKSSGFDSYSYNPFDRTLTKAKLHDFDNLIYVRDLNFVMDRLSSASKVKILDLDI